MQQCGHYGYCNADIFLVKMQCFDNACSCVFTNI